MASIRIIKSGLLTTIQDGGRWGWQAFGVPVAGPMDPYSHRLANLLVGNGRDAAGLEVTLVGPEIEFDDDRVVAVTGAVFNLELNGSPAQDHRAFTVSRGSRLKFGRRFVGSRAYVAVSGGVSVPPTLGSRATHVTSHMGGLEGRSLTAGDRVPLGAVGTRVKRRHAVPDPAGGSVVRSRVTGHPARVRVLAGPQDDLFTEETLTVLQSAPYRIGSDSDRMGFRLEGPRLRHRETADIISDATPFGALQVPASGQPVLLMADRQTTGGYAKLATVISADLGVVGQLAPGDRIAFEVCTPETALAALIADERRLMALETGGNGADAMP